MPGWQRTSPTPESTTSEAPPSDAARLADPSDDEIAVTTDVAVLRSLASRIKPDDPGAHNNLGVVYFQKGMFAEAVNEFEHALMLDPRMELTRRNLEIAFFRSGLFEERVAELRGRLLQRPEDREARRRLAGTYLLGGDPAAAIGEWTHLLENEEDEENEATIRLQLARAEVERGELEGAQRHVERALAVAGDDPLVHARLAEISYGRGRYDEAIGHVERALELDPGNADAHHLLGFIYGELGESERAAAAIAQAAELNPSYARAEANLSLEGYSADRFAELVGGLDVSADPSDAPFTRYKLGKSFRERGLHDEALRELELALERGEDHQRARPDLAVLLLVAGAQRDDAAVTERAASLYRELLEEDAASPRLWNERGVAAHRLGRLTEAEDAYRRALEIDRESDAARNNLAVARCQRGDHGDAEQAFREALDRPTPSPHTWQNLGLMLVGQGSARAATEAYQHAVELDPGAADAWTDLGTALIADGRAEESKLALAHAVQADPALAAARYHLAFALASLNDDEGALRETRRALELSTMLPGTRFRLLVDRELGVQWLAAPDSAALEAGREEPQPRSSRSPGPDLLARGLACLEADDLAGAEAALQTRLRSDPAAVAARRALASVFARTGRIEAAAAELGRALDLLPSYGPAALDLAELELSRGRPEAAVNVLADLLTFDPDCLNALVQLVRALDESGRTEEAEQASRHRRRLHAELADDSDGSEGERAAGPGSGRA